MAIDDRDYILHSLTYLLRANDAAMLSMLQKMERLEKLEQIKSDIKLAVIMFGGLAVASFL